jgi:hypothetical protein
MDVLELDVALPIFRVELGTFFKARQIVQLGFGDSGLSAHGRVDVDSKRATNQHGHLQLHQFLEHR